MLFAFACRRSNDTLNVRYFHIKQLCLRWTNHRETIVDSQDSIARVFYRTAFSTTKTTSCATLKSKILMLARARDGSRVYSEHHIDFNFIKNIGSSYNVVINYKKREWSRICKSLPSQRKVILSFLFFFANIHVSLIRLILLYRGKTFHTYGI